MKTKKSIAILLGVLMIVSIFVTSVMAQLSKEELASIGMPDEIKTAIGTLRAENGVPSAETAELVYDYVDRMRGVQAFIDNQGAASMYGCLRGYASLGATKANQPVIHERPMDADAIYLVANSQTVYVFLFLDLKTDGPTVLESPPETMGLMDDMWQNYVADLGVTGPDKGKGGKYLILPPGYKGEVPKGYYVVKSSTYRVWYCGRGFLKDGDNKPAVENFKTNLKIYPLAKADNPPKTEFVNASGRQYNTVSPNTIQYFHDINECVQYEPIEALDVERRGVLKAIGIEKGKPFNPDARMKRLLSEAAAIGNAYYRSGYWRPQNESNIIYKGTKKRWMTGYPDHNPTFITNGAMELNWRMFFYCIGTGVTPYMAAMHAGEGSDYAVNYSDADGNPLAGSKNYKLILPANIPVARFWSIIVYDSQSRSFVRTSQPGATLSSVFGGVEQNKDGSTDIYFGPKAPKGKEKNWLQTVPGDTWFICLRMYGPEKPWLDHIWQPGEIELVK